jgi:oxalate decarboxylase family bicupin protein
MSEFTRRSFIGKTAVAIGSFAALQKVVNAANPTDPGPANRVLDGQNPDSMWPPATDSKSLVQNFKYPFSFANKRVYDGGWSREVTVRELPVSKTLAGVNMRLNAGGFRELHWHTASEWAIMLYGSARLTAIDLDGKSFVADVNKNDLWFFPPGIPHSIQGLNPDGCEFMLVFDDGNFSESETVLLSDAMGICRLRCWQKISLSANRHSKTSRNKNYSFFKRIYQVHWKPTRRQRPGRAESRHRTLFFARWKCRRRCRRSRARCALLIPAILKSQPRRWHWSPFIPAG